ncbi:MAG: hypothetical protein PVG39_25020 [Desulfobacteraceae bacterium]|jgi:hypothetical protein
MNLFKRGTIKGIVIFITLLAFAGVASSAKLSNAQREELVSLFQQMGEDMATIDKLIKGFEERAAVESQPVFDQIVSGSMKLINHEIRLRALLDERKRQVGTWQNAVKHGKIIKEERHGAYVYISYDTTRDSTPDIEVVFENDAAKTAIAFRYLDKLGKPFC